VADIDRAVLEHLRDGATGAGTRIRPEFKKQNEQFPAIVVRRVGEPTELLLDGAHDTKEARFQIDVWARSYSELVTISNQVAVLFDAFSGNMGTVPVVVQYSQKENEVDLSEVDGDLVNRRRSLDFVMRYEE